MDCDVSSIFYPQLTRVLSLIVEELVFFVAGASRSGDNRRCAHPALGSDQFR